MHEYVTSNNLSAWICVIHISCEVPYRLGCDIAKWRAHQRPRLQSCCSLSLSLSLIFAKFVLNFSMRSWNSKRHSSIFKPINCRTCNFTLLHASSNSIDYWSPLTRKESLYHTLSISSSSCMKDLLAWLRPKCCSSKDFIASPLDLSWASLSDCAVRGKVKFNIVSLYRFKQRSRIPLLKTSTRDPVDGISPLFKASSIWNF